MRAQEADRKFPWTLLVSEKMTLADGPQEISWFRFLPQA